MKNPAARSKTWLRELLAATAQMEFNCLSWNMQKYWTTLKNKA